MRIVMIAAAAGIAIAAASEAQALQVLQKIDVAAAPDKVWATMGDFCSIQGWHPAVEKCEIEKKGTDTFRTLSLKGGGTIREQQTGRSDDTHTYSYSIIESPLPVQNYVSTITVAPADKGSTVTWTSTFDAKGASDADATAAIEGIYKAGLDSIKSKF